MEYIIITLLAIAATTCLVYLLANKVFAVRLRLKSLILCAACALFLSLILPRIVVSFVGLAGTVGFLALFAVIFAYFVAYYDDPKDLQPAGNGLPANPSPLSDEPANAGGEPAVYTASCEAVKLQLETFPEIAPISADSGYPIPTAPLEEAATAETEDEQQMEPIDIQPPLDPLSGQLYSEPEPEPDAEQAPEAEAVIAEEPEPPTAFAAELESEPANDMAPVAAATLEPELIIEAEQAASAQDEPEPATVPELGILLESFAAIELEVEPELESADDDMATFKPEAKIEAQPEQTAPPEAEPDKTQTVEPEPEPEPVVNVEPQLVAEPGQAPKEKTVGEPEEIIQETGSEPETPQEIDDQTGLELEIELNLITPVASAETEPDEENTITISRVPSTEDEPSPVSEPIADETATDPEAEAESLVTLAIAAPEDSAAPPLTKSNLANPEPMATEGAGSTAAAADDEPPPEESEVTLVAEPVTTSLEDLLDFAFAQKDRNNLALALDTFRRAYKLYRESEAGPLLVVEIAGLLKAKGAYDEAVTILSDGRSLPTLQQNPLLDQEFVTTIAYLRIVKNTLMQNRIGFVPFQRIPADIAKEIDDEFREWRNLA